MTEWDLDIELHSNPFKVSLWKDSSCDCTAAGKETWSPEKGSPIPVFI